MVVVTLVAALSTALGAAQDDWQDPTTMLGVGWAPWGLNVRGSALFGSQVSAELGVGVRDFDPEQPVVDWAVYWRPPFACLGCGERALVTMGLGVGGPVSPDLDGGPWAIGVGPSLTASGVAWLGRSAGLQVSGVVGFGPTVLTDSAFTFTFDDPWYIVSAGVAF